MASIVFNGTTLLDEAVNGAGWKFTPGEMVAAPAVVEASRGVGFWVKAGNRSPAVHRLEAQWRSATPMSIQSAIRAVAVAGAVGTLTVPTFGSFSNCLLSGVGEWDLFQSDGGVYILSNTLTFTEYPS